MSTRNWGWPKPSGSLVQAASRTFQSVGLAVMFLSSCTPNATPFPAPTVTHPGANASPVATQNTTVTPDAPLPSPTSVLEEPVLPSEIALDRSLMERVRDELAAETGVAVADIRLAQVEAGEWSLNILGCTNAPSEIVTKGTIVRLLAG